jgi:hypothetical protein
MSVPYPMEVEMLFKNLRRSSKPVPSESSPINQDQKSQSEDIQKLIDNAIIANKPSRLQVFEPHPPRFSKFWK